MTDRSLDEFVGAAAEPASPTDPPDGDADLEPAPAEESEEPSPIETTRSWSPEGAICEGCGAVVEERWRDGDGLVCAACKEW